MNALGRATLVGALAIALVGLGVPWGVLTANATGTVPIVTDVWLDVGGVHTTNVDEGQTFRVAGTFDDPDTDETHFALVQLQPGTVFSTSTAGSSAFASGPKVYADSGIYTLTVKIQDCFNSCAVSSTSDPFSITVTVRNAPPTATFNARGFATEGQTFTLAFTNPVDVAADLRAGLTYAFDCGTGYGTYSASTSAICTALDGPATLAVHGKVKDKDGGETEYTASVDVSNVAPTATFNAPANAAEGSVSLSLTNPVDVRADLSSLTYAFDCGGGGGYGAFDSANSTTCNVDGPATLHVLGKVKDKDGGETEYSGDVAVTNVAPTATFNAPASADEGGSFDLSLSSPVDVAADLAGLTYAFDCGGGYGGSSSASSATCAAADGPATLHVKGKVMDKDGGETEYPADVTIANVAPTATFSAPSTVDENTSFTLSLSGGSDVAADTLTYAFDCGTGAGYGTAGSASSATCAAGDGPATVHVKGKVMDEDGGATEYLADVTVKDTTKTAAELLSALKALIHSYDLDSGTENSFITQIDNAMATLGDKDATCSSLNAFVNHVSAQSGKQLSWTQVAAVWSIVDQLEVAVPCGNLTPDLGYLVAKRSKGGNHYS